MFRHKRPPVGATPGTLVRREEARAPKIHVLHYSADGVAEYDIHSLADLRELQDRAGANRFWQQLQEPKSVTWIDVQGLGDEALLRALAESFKLHSLTIADIINLGQRPKLEEHDEYLLVIAEMAHPTLESGTLDLEQVSVVIGRNYVITFQEHYGDIFDPIRLRIRESKGSIRKSGSDYLGYALIDAVVDGYFPVLEQIGEHFEELEERVLFSPVPATLQAVYQGKRELLRLRRAVWPLREALVAMSREGTPHVKKPTKVYLRDTYDHIIQVIDILESYREIAGSFTDIYLSSVSNKTNEVMKVLTMMATIFIPLSFIAGVYGMNFEYMPELKYRWAYPALWVIIITIAGGLLLYFRRMGWLGSPESSGEE